MSADDWPVQVDSTFGCWIWEGRRDRHGYSRTKDNRLAYNVVYQAEVGAIPEGKVLDHQCRVRACTNPAHLEPVSKSENERRKSWGYRCKRKVCPNGHDLYSHGRRTVYGGIICRTCSGV